MRTKTYLYAVNPNCLCFKLSVEFGERHCCVFSLVGSSTHMPQTFWNQEAFGEQISRLLIMMHGPVLQFCSKTSSEFGYIDALQVGREQESTALKS